MPDISPYLLQWFALIAVFTLAVISPGPDFVMVVRNAVVHSRRAGIMTALGLGASILIHVTYTVLGLAAVIAQSVMLFNAIKYAGAAYLIYIGIKSLRSKGVAASAIDKAVAQDAAHKPKQMTDLAAMRCGFLTNALNPKATLFFLAIFSQIVRADTPLAWQAAYGLTCAAIIIAWFSLVSVVLTHRKVRHHFLKATKWIDRVCGGLMIALGIKVALTTR
ncbi:MAG: LysE family translocator [Bdellovibrionales bacterium]